MKLRRLSKLLIVISVVAALRLALPVYGEDVGHVPSEAVLRTAIVAALGHEPEQLVFESRRADLNGDGPLEVIVWIPTLSEGGTSGYPLLIFTQRAGGLELLQSDDQVWTPIVILNTRHNGWRDLAVTRGGGGDPMRFFVWRYDASPYAAQSAWSGKERPRGLWLFTNGRTNTTFGPLPTRAELSAARGSAPVL